MKWFRSTAGKISLALIIASIIMIIGAWSTFGEYILPENNASIFDNILIGLATNLVGLVVTLLFVQYFLNKQDKENERKEEIKKIKRFDKYMQALIKRFLRLFVALTTNIDDRKNISINDAYKHEFKLSDMADMYKMSLYLGEPLLEPTIVLFYDAETKLREYMLRMLESIDFKYFPQIADVLQEFVVQSSEINVSGQILGNQKIKAGDKLESEMFSDWLKDESNDWLGKYNRGELNGNAMLPYVILYYQVKEQCQMLKKYNDYISDLG